MFPMHYHTTNLMCIWSTCQYGKLG